jgi:hypothetical protein
MYIPEYNLWKIGCTAEELTRRFRQEKTKITLVYSEVLPSGVEAYKLEGYLLREFREFKYRGPKVLKSGNTELLVQEVPFEEALAKAKAELGITNGS